MATSLATMTSQFATNLELYLTGALTVQSELSKPTLLPRFEISLGIRCLRTNRVVFSTVITKIQCDDSPNSKMLTPRVPFGN